MLLGALELAVWLAATAALAGVQAARSWRGETRPLPAAVAAGAAVAVVGAWFGVVPFVVAAAVGLGGAGLWASTAGADVTRTVACAAVPVAAVAPLVLLRSTDGIVPALVLLTYVAVYDSAAYVMGAGTRWRWVGPVAGMAWIGSVTIAVAAIFPQFKGMSPWELGLVAAVSTPVGRVVADRIVGTKNARVPALRRLDSLVVVGPVWAVAAALLVS